MTKNQRRGVLLPILLGICLVIPVGASLADECKATLDATLMKEEEEQGNKTYRFKVDLNTLERCAEIAYELHTVEAESGKDDRAKTKTYGKRVRDGEITSAEVTYKVPARRRLVSWEFKVKSCELCGGG